MGSAREKPVKKLGALGELIPISGAHHVHINSVFDLRTFRAVWFDGAATFREVDKIDRRLRAVLRSWEVGDQHWRDDLLTAVNELTTNIAQHAECIDPSESPTMHVLAHTMEDEQWRYVWVWIVGEGVVACDPSKLRPELPDDPNAEHGRGTFLTAVFTDAFIVEKDANSFFVMKRAPR